MCPIRGRMGAALKTWVMFMKSILENCKIGDQGCYSLGQIKAPKLSTLSLSK